MKYSDLIQGLSERTGLTESQVRIVLEEMPTVLVQCPEGDQTRTPLGVFKAVIRQEKRVRLPDGTWVIAKPQKQIKLKPGLRLREDL
jgi:hypothetical protein